MGEKESQRRLRKNIYKVFNLRQIDPREREKDRERERERD